MIGGIWTTVAKNGENLDVDCLNEVNPSASKAPIGARRAPNPVAVSIVLVIFFIREGWTFFVQAGSLAVITTIQKQLVLEGKQIIQFLAEESQ